MTMSGAAQDAYEDPAGNRLSVHALTSTTAVVRITQDDDESEPPKVAEVIITPDDMQAMADAVRRACERGQL